MSLRRPPIESLTVDDLRFAVRWSARRRTVGITVKRDGELVVAAPSRTSARRLEDVVREKLPWVRRKLAEFEALGPPPEPRQVVAGELFPYLGREYRLELADRPPQPREPATATPSQVDRALDGEARAAVVAWYEARAREYIDEAVARYVPLVGAAPATVVVRDLGKRRWGVCDHRTLDGELPLAADHAAARAGRLRRRARAGPPPRAQPRGGVLAAGRGRACRTARSAASASPGAATSWRSDRRARRRARIRIRHAAGVHCTGMTRARHPDDLQSIPGVGPSIAADLRRLGIRRTADLAGRDPQQLYEQLEDLAGQHVDRCVLYVFRAAVHHAGGAGGDPELAEVVELEGRRPRRAARPRLGAACRRRLS